MNTHCLDDTKILLIGLDAADWDLVTSKVQEGKLPHLAKLIENGTSGPLRSTHPLFSPALWSTIATGKRPYEHGITGFTLPDEAGTGLKTYDSSSRRVPAIWNILSQAKKTSHVINWWNSAPAEKINGVMVDETFRIAELPLLEPWNVSSSSVSPASIASSLAKNRVHPQKLPEHLLHALIPKLYEIDPQRDFRISAIAKILAEDLTALQVTLQLIAEKPSDFTTLYLQGLDSLAHLAMPYRFPTQDGEDPRDCELYGDIVDRAYELYDSWIGKLVATADEKTTIMLVSDHGFYHDHRKPPHLGIEATAPCAHHAPIGTIILRGPLIKKTHTLSHASILDICPTILALLDLPVGKDMPGNVLKDAFKDPISKKTILSWNYFYHPPSSISKLPLDTTEAALRQLVALGYLPELPSNKKAAIQEAQCNQLFHLALSYINEERLDRAIPLLKQALQEAQQAIPPRTDILGELAYAYLLLEKWPQAADYFHQIVNVRSQDAQEAAALLAQKSTLLNSSQKLSFSEMWELRRLIARANLDQEGISFLSTFAKALLEPDKTDASLLFSLASQKSSDAFLNINAAIIAFAQNNPTQACLLLEQAARERSEEAEPLIYLAEYKNKIGSFKDAEQHARDGLARNPLHCGAWYALAISLFSQHEYKEACKAAKKASRSVVRKEKAYDLLSKIAEEEKDFKRANQYYSLAKRSAQFLKEALISSSQTIHPQEKHASFLKKSSKKILQKKSNPTAPIIITGLPRSGTSLLMQMLYAGGIKLVTDTLRKADLHNPQGYFEHEAIKNIEKDASFLQSKTACKIVIPLLWKLPLQGDYKIIWIQRPLDEVIESQHRMAGSLGTAEQLKHAYKYYELKTLHFLQEHSWPFLKLQHAALISNPYDAAEKIACFLEKDLNIEAMAAVVIPNLYRVRK